MCILQDVYHAKCGHWADRPRIKRSCAAAREHRIGGDIQSSSSGMRITQPCTNSKTDGFFEDRNDKCSKCRMNLDGICSKAGTWLSCGIDSTTGKPYFRERKPESEASRQSRLRKRDQNQRQPSAAPLSSSSSSHPMPEKPMQPLKPRPGYLGSIPMKSKPEDMNTPLTPLSPGAEYWWKKSREEDERKASVCSWSSHGHVEL